MDRIDSNDLIIEGDSEFGRLFCKFNSDDTNIILQLREEDRVRVKGTLNIRSSLFGMRLYMNDCRVF